MVVNSFTHLHKKRRYFFKMPYTYTKVCREGQGDNKLVYIRLDNLFDEIIICYEDDIKKAIDEHFTMLYNEYVCCRDKYLSTKALQLKYTIKENLL